MTAQIPYGAWPSAVSPQLAVAGAARLGDVRGEDGVTWWSASRPAEGGRIQIVRREPDGATSDLLGEGFNARTRVHEYGGGAWWVDRKRVFFTNFADQRLYRLDPGAEPVAISEEPAEPHALRYADGVLTPDGETVVCVRERHEGGAVHNEIVALPAAGGPARILTGGHDFYAAPRVSPDGARLTWLTWDHPDMPWDATCLWVAELTRDGDGEFTLTDTRCLAGGVEDQPESLAQPEWSPSGDLFVISDRDDWWNVYRVKGFEDGPGPDAEPEIVPVHPVPAEVGVPAWVFGRDRFAIAADGTVLFTYSDAKGAHLVAAPADGAPVDHITGYGYLEPVRLAVGGSRLLAVAASGERETSVVESTDSGRTWTALLAGSDHALETISRAQHISFPSAGERIAHGWYFAPAGCLDGNAVKAPDGDLPPLLVKLHGGPTAAADASFSPATQFWTSRGFAVVLVDYGGSTGYGRPYRQLLNDSWGIVDVQDAVAAATWLAGQGLADPARMAITGGSAGGFTVLMALATSDVFSAGANYFGVSDLAALARDTHKFESRYLDRLVGPWPEAAEIYRERSPLSRLDGFRSPLIVFQGLEDAVVPPSQSELIVSALAERGVPHAYLAFPGEQHGFRRAENILRCLTGELSFYAQVFGIEPAGDIEPVEIVNSHRLPRRDVPVRESP